MNNEEHTEKESRRHGPPGMHGGMEKPKNLKKAIKRLTQGLKDFKLLILVSLILAAAGSILAIFTPNIIKDLTDEISKGLVEILLRSFLANLLAAWVIVIDSK